MFQDQELGSSNEREGGEKRKGAERAYGGIFRHGVLERRKERESASGDSMMSTTAEALAESSCYPGF